MREHVGRVNSMNEALCEICQREPVIDETVDGLKPSSKQTTTPEK